MFTSAAALRHDRLAEAVRGALVHRAPDQHDVREAPTLTTAIAPVRRVATERGAAARYPRRIGEVANPEAPRETDLVRAVERKGDHPVDIRGIDACILECSPRGLGGELQLAAPGILRELGAARSRRSRRRTLRFMLRALAAGIRARRARRGSVRRPPPPAADRSRAPPYPRLPGLETSAYAFIERNQHHHRRLGESPIERRMPRHDPRQETRPRPESCHRLRASCPRQCGQHRPRRMPKPRAAPATLAARLLAAGRPPPRRKRRRRCRPDRERVGVSLIPYVAAGFATSQGLRRRVGDRHRPDAPFEVAVGAEFSRSRRS